MTDSEFQAVFDQHKDAVYRFAWRMVGSAEAAEDVAQDVFLVLLRQPLRFDPVQGNGPGVPAGGGAKPRVETLA